MTMSASNAFVFWDFDSTLAYRDGGWTVSLHRILLRNGVSSVTLEELRPHMQSGFPWHSPEVPHSELFDGREWWEYLDVKSWSLFPDTIETL